jgi:hypothetical protein
MQTSRKSFDRYQEKLKQLRRSNEDTARFIWVDSRRRDRKYGQDNDLTKEWIEAAIKDGCAYCGETALRMTLDRKDNNLGHVKSNVVPCCIRCNYARGSMPFEAWQHLAPSLRSARESRLFGKWTGRVN